MSMLCRNVYTPMLALGMLIGSVSASFGVETRTWFLQDRASLEEGTSQGVSVAGDGHLSLGPASESIASFDEPVVSALARGTGATFFVGTGGTGAIYRVEASGDKTLLASDLGVQVGGLASDTQGNVFAAWNPDGTILRIAPDGVLTTLHDPDARYVWGLKRRSHDLYAVTGSPAQLLRLPVQGGDPEVLFRLPEKNFTALAIAESSGRNDAVYIGTEGKGLVLEISASGESRVLWDSNYRQITALAAGSEGEVYAAAFGKPLDPEKDEEPPDPKDSPSEVVHIGRDGSIESMWRGKGEPVFSLALSTMAGRDSPVPIAGTGAEGKVFALEGEGRSLLLDTEQEQVSAVLARGDDTVLVATANLGSVLQVGPRLAERGEFLSPIFDAKVRSQWGAFRWEGDVPAGSEARFETRSGDTGKPDSTWSEWERTKQGKVVSPASRWLQWRAIFSSKRAPGPSIDHVEVAYLQGNEAPKVQTIVVHEPGFVYDKKLANESIKKDGTDRFSSTADPSKNSEPLVIPGWRTLSWKASDENGDLLLFELQLRRDEAGSGWFTLAKDLEGSAFAWDSRSLANGYYHVRVTATDAASNPPSLSMESSEESGPFLIDTRPPEIDDLAVISHRGAKLIAFRATDPEDRILAAAYSIAGRPWTPALPEDGISDEPLERFRIGADDIEPGDLVVVRVKDRSGNLSSRSVTAR